MDLIEKIARIINPIEFKQNENLRIYCMRQGDGEEKSKETADWAHPLTDSFDKARAIISIIESERAEK